MFEETVGPYQEALRKSGYTHRLEFKPPQQDQTEQKRKRRRNIIWFNPPYNKNVKTNIGRAFISLLEKSFPTDHKLRKIMNRNTVKLSYSCMPNIKQIIDNHNKAVLKAEETAVTQRNEWKACNCRKRDECPLNGECLVKEVVYQATVTVQPETPSTVTETYIGLTATDFKARYRNHQTSFRQEARKNATELSKYLWRLKEEKKEYTVKWKVIARAKPYTNNSKRCDLCTTEKMFLITKPHMATLNKRNELVSACRHKRRFVLKYGSTSRVDALAQTTSD